MPRFLIHVGPHKTGTTYLQRAFTQMRSAMEAGGILYPENWQSGSGHAVLYQRLREGDATLAPEFDALRASPCKVVLISSEDISVLDEAGIEYLRKLVGDATGEIVFYLRRWSELLPSAWQEGVKHGFVDTFPEYVLRHLENPERSETINCGIKIDRFISAFGRSNVHLVSYSKLVDDGVDLFKHFCATFLGWEPLSFEMERSNESLSRPEVEIVRALNSMMLAKTGQLRPSVFAGYRRLARRQPKRIEALTSLMSAHTGELKLRDAGRLLEELHLRLFEQYGDLLVPPKPGKRLFKPKVAVVPYIRQTYLTEDGAAETLRRFYRQLVGNAPQESKAA